MAKVAQTLDSAPESTHPPIEEVAKPVVKQQVQTMDIQGALQALLSAQMQAAQPSSSSSQSQATLQTSQAALLTSLVTPPIEKDSKLAAADEEKEEPPIKPKPEKRRKTKAEELWQECLVLGRKLEGVQANGRSIVKQAKDPQDVWRWAVTEVDPLVPTLDAATSTIDLWSSTVRPGHFAIFLLTSGASSEATLIDLKTAIDKHISAIAVPLSELITMHQAKLRRRATELQPVKPAKKAKAKAKATTAV